MRRTHVVHTSYTSCYKSANKLLQICSQAVDKLCSHCLFPIVVTTLEQDVNLGQAVRTQLGDGLLTDLLQDVRFLRVQYTHKKSHNLSTRCVRNRLVANLSTSSNNAVISSTCYKVVAYNLLTNC
jgi:hypothetical protein